MNAEHLRIVLVETTHPGNIGAAARAMKTMGLHRLILVNPARFPHPEAQARAAGAHDILARACIVDSLDAALVGCHLIIGASARRRGMSGPELTPRQCASRAAACSLDCRVALVFGRESSGLTNDEMDRCQLLVRIPTDPAFRSLNLAAAVQVLAYEVYTAAQNGEASPPAQEGFAPAEEMRRFYEHLQQVLLETGFLNPANPRHLMRRLRHLFNRAQPTQNEINILRGILSSVQGRKRPPRPESDT